MRRRLCIGLIAGLMCVPLARGQIVVGDVSSVGFRASTTNGTGMVARSGQWVPIQVRLAVQGSQLFQGQLRFEAVDLDGDLVSYVEKPVTVTPDAGLKRVWCYAVALGVGRTATLDILSEEGRLVNRLNVPAFDLIRNDTLLILDISEKPLTRLRLLETPGWRPYDSGYGVRPYYRNVLVAAMPAAELPDRWIGLEAVDVVVWDRPNPTMTNMAQLQALTQWVRNGGQLVLGLGQSWPLVQNSELAEIVPVLPLAGGPPGSGGQQRPTMEVDRLGQFFSKLVRPSQQRRADERTFRAPISVALVAARPGALRAMREQIPGGPTFDLITAGWVDSGRVIAVAASLRDLMEVPVNDAFHAQLFDLNPTTEKFLEDELGALQYAIRSDHKLYGEVVRPIGFTGWSGVLVLAAFAFVVVYIGLATLAGWSWLKRHSLANLNWTVFALFAIAASAVSLGTVGVLRGVSRGVRSLSLVDLESGGRTARAKCYFGYSSPIRRRVDLSLSGEGGYLRPLTPGPDGTDSYATPQRYSALSGRGRLEGTPMRATLKQFEGFWQGELDGSIRAELHADRRSGEITSGSWIQNDLDVDLVGGYLIYVDPRFQGNDRAARPAGKTNRYWKGKGGQDVPPGLNLLAVWMPPIAAGQKVSGIGRQQYELVRQARDKWLTRWALRDDRKLADMPDLPTLWHEQQFWIGYARQPAGPPRRLDLTARYALLASTRTFYLHCREDFEKVNNAPITTDGLMGCDVSHWLMQEPLGNRGQAVLLLLANAPGPAALHGNGKPLKAAGSRTLYRVRVPISFQGSPPRADWP